MIYFLPFVQAGLEFSQSFEKRIDEYLAKSKEERAKLKQKSLHNYKPEDYGLTKEGIREEFKDYIAKYKLVEK